MNGEEFYNIHKGKMVITHDNVKGIVVGYRKDDISIIIAVKSKEHVGWQPLNYNNEIILQQKDNVKGFWFDFDNGIKKIYQIFKYGK